MSGDHLRVGDVVIWVNDESVMGGSIGIVRDVKPPSPLRPPDLVLVETDGELSNAVGGYWYHPSNWRRVTQEELYRWLLRELSS